MDGKAEEQTEKTIRVERTFDVSPEPLWRAWTDPMRFAQWHHPAPDTKLVIHEFEAREGGRVLYDMPVPGGESHRVEMVFHELVPYQRIVMGTPDRSILTWVRFYPDGTKTRMVVEMTGMPEEHREGAVAGWQGGFEKLARLVEDPERERSTP